MNQEIQKKKILVRKTKPGKVLEEIVKGNKFIVVDGELDDVPEGYTLVDMKFKGDSFKTLVPQQLLFYLANPGEGGVIDDALDQVSDFYGEVKDLEDESIEEGNTNVQGVNWATTSRNTYEVYLINKLTNNGKDFDKGTLDELDLNDSYVKKRVEAIAALCLEKSPEELKKREELSDILKHVTVNAGKETINTTELTKVRCEVGSHYEYREKYIKVRKTVNKKENYVVLDKKVHELEQEIQDYRLKKHDNKLGRHDEALIRQYVNLAYIAKEKPETLLDVYPEGKEK